MCLNFFFQGMVIEMVFSNKIHYFSLKFSFHYFKTKIVVCIIEKHLRLNLKTCHLKKISIKYQIPKMMFCVMFRSNKLNRMHIIILLQKKKMAW